MNDELPESGDSDMDTAIETNSGGRVRFQIGAEVRYVQMDGTVSNDIYLIDQERSDRKGHLSLKERLEGEGDKRTPRVVRVHHRRILPVDMEGKAVVIESQDKHWCLCPTDGTAIEVSPGDTETTCPKCSTLFSLHWIGVRPMADATKTKEPKTETAAAATKAPKAEKAEKAAPKPKPEKVKEPKEPKAVKEPIVVDLTAIAKHKGVELWTKKNVKFDHERIDVQAHVLLFTGDNPRKLCFNTYNGALGKKAPELPVTEFLANEPVKGAAAKKDTPWFPVPDLDKARAKLSKDGYEQAK